MVILRKSWECLRQPGTTHGNSQEILRSGQAGSLDGIHVLPSSGWPRLAKASLGWPRLAQAGPGWPRVAQAGSGPRVDHLPGINGLFSRDKLTIFQR